MKFSALCVPAISVAVHAAGDFDCGSCTERKKIEIDHDIAHPSLLFRNMICKAVKKKENINCWDTSQVRDMSYTFASNPTSSCDVSMYNEPLNCWDTSRVTSMYEMFKGTDFNQLLDSWDTGNVDTMSRMFKNWKFNQNIDMWDIPKVVGAYGMFYGAENFNQCLRSWMAEFDADEYKYKTFLEPSRTLLQI